MSVYDNGHESNFWFGTIDSMRWFPTPNSGADVSSEGWESGGTLLDGGGYQAHSFGSHGNFTYEWPPSSSQRTAQTMKSYRDGTFGRGLLYFVDPLQFHTNVLPPYWADPSMTMNEEVPNLTKEPFVPVTSVPTPNPGIYDLPVRSVTYDLGDVLSGWRGEGKALFVPIPKDHSLLLGAMYSHTGHGRVLMRKVYHDGELGPVLEVPARSTAAVDIADIVADSSDSKGVYLFIGKTGIGAGSVTLSAMIGRLIETRKTISQSVATNLFTNPNLVGTGTYATVAENLFTNPRLVGDGTWAEVRRNRVKNPSAAVNVVGSGPYGVNMSVSRVTFAGEPWYQVEATAGVTALGMYVEIGTLFAVGDRAGVSFDIRAASGGSYPSATVRTIMGGITGANQVSETKSVTETPLRVSLIVSSVASGGTFPERVYVGIVGSFSAGAKVYFRRILVGDAGNFFDGSTMDESMIQPEDFRVRWLGEPNASESVMEIERVAGFSAHRCVAGVSTWEGRPAVRLIPTHTSNNDSIVSVALPVGFSGTGMGTVHQVEPLSGSIKFDSNRILTATSPWGVYSPIPPNVPGSYPQRISIPARVGAGQFRLNHGGLLGSGDVWWTDIGLFAGNYTGENFNGSDDPSVTGFDQPEDFRIRWTGEVDNSTSVLEIETVRNLLTESSIPAIAGVSTWGGKPAVRLIHLLSYARAYFVIPVEARAEGTFIASLHMREPLSGSGDNRGRSVVMQSPTFQSDRAPNVPGSYDLRVEYSDLLSPFWATLFGGSSAGETWWTDIGLFAGEYDGPWFSGDSGGVVIDGRNYTPRWDGEPNNSTSTAWTPTPDYDRLKAEPWIGGQGHSGCRFVGVPTYIKYTGINDGQVGFAATFREVGHWTYR